MFLGQRASGSFLSGRMIVSQHSVIDGVVTVNKRTVPAYVVGGVTFRFGKDSGNGATDIRCGKKVASTFVAGQASVTVPRITTVKAPGVDSEPMTVPLLRTSERGDFKRCPWLWDKTWNQGLTTRREPTWAWFGTAIHKGLEAWYIIGTKRGKLQSMIDTFEAALNETTRRIWTEGKTDLDEQEVVDARELGIAMLRGYVDFYGQDDEWEVVQTEQPFQIEVVSPFNDSEVLVNYAGTWDALMRNRVTKAWWIWDHKTRKSFPSNWEVYSINDQAGSYLWVAPEILRHLGIFGKKDVLEGLVFNALKKAMPDKRPVNADGLSTNLPKKEDYIAALTARDIHVPAKGTLDGLAAIAEQFHIKVFGQPSMKQPSPLFHREEIWRSPEERVKQASRVQAEALAMKQMRDGTLSIWKTPTEDCVRCKIFEYCQLDESSVEDGKILAKNTLVKRDPYRDHRVDFDARGISLDTVVNKKEN
jgi:hypothetical protein